MAKIANCLKIGDDFVDIIVVAKDGTFMKTDKDLLNRAILVLRKEL